MHAPGYHAPIPHEDLLPVTPLQQGLITALGVGLLIGLMRERRSDDPDSGPSAAGLRTHALAALGTAVAWHLGPYVFLAVLAISGLLITVSYRRTAETDVGLTGEVALMVTVLLGALSMVSAGVAGQIALRIVGARFGFPVARFFSGFASSTAATAGYGQRAKDEPKLLTFAASAAAVMAFASQAAWRSWWPPPCWRRGGSLPGAASWSGW